MRKFVPKHALFVRICHWLNAPILAIMIWSGLLIYWAHDEYAIEVGGFVLIKFFPEAFYRVLDLERGLAVGIAYHFAFAWLFALNGLAYVLYTFWSGHWRELLPTWRTPFDAWQVVLHDLGIRKTPLPPGKFNGAQKIAYTGVLLMGVGSLLTGLAILKPTQLAWLTTCLGGYPMARILHFALTIGYVLFFIVHITQVIRAGWNNFQSMVTGSEFAHSEGSEHVHNPTTH